MINQAVRWLIWPVCLIAHSAPVLLAAALAPTVLSPVAAGTTVVLTLILVVVEAWLPYRADWSLRDDSEVWRDLGHAVAYVGLATNGSRILFLIVAAKATSLLGLTNILHLWPEGRPFWMQVVLAVIVGDLLEYTYHRAAHSHAVLWRLHAIHHTSVRLHVLKGARHHAAYALGRGVFVWLPLLMLGAPPEAIIWQFIAVTITGLAAHANVAFRIPALAHRLLVTPDFHRVHHAVDPRLGNSNFAAVFPIWDIVFRTHIDPLNVEVTDAGIQDDPIPRRFVAELKWPLAR
jgi:ornithine lipid hydroxylase